MSRSNYLHITDNFNLNEACKSLVKVYGQSLYLVGSVLTKPDYRDVDVRLILSDEDFDLVFNIELEKLIKSKLDPEIKDIEVEVDLTLHKKMSEVAISTWLEKITGLKIDFQFQRRTQANAEFDGLRHALGITF